MLIRKFKALLKKQAGFTLIEFIVGIAIMGVLGTGIMATTSQLIKENSRSRSQMQAIQQVENVGSWLTRDVQQSKTVTPAAAPGFPLVLNWVDDAANTYQVTYSIVGTKLRRSYVENGGAAVQTYLADNLVTGSANTSCSYSGGILTFKITVQVGTVSETRTYRIKNRPV